ncbi:MAG: hypothetical protein V3V10_03285 [Planctomycetota bacterium]
MILPEPIRAFNPFDDGAECLEVKSTSELTSRILSGPGLPALADWSHHHIQVLSQPEFVYQGIRVDILFHEESKMSDDWLCYTSRVKYYHDYDEAEESIVEVEIEHGGLEETYCVFINNQRNVYFAEFRDCDASGRVVDADTSFGKVLLEPNND